MVKSVRKFLEVIQVIKPYLAGAAKLSPLVSIETSLYEMATPEVCAAIHELDAQSVLSIVDKVLEKENISSARTSDEKSLATFFKQFRVSH